MALMFVWVLAGCATTPGAQLRPWNSKGPRTLALMSDSSGMVGEPNGPTLKGYNVPGRNPDSRMPWKLFLGGASHRLIAYMYGVRHPDRQVYYNNKHIKIIIEETGIGDVSRLLPGEHKMSPDITDITRRVLFEIKPWHEQGLQEGRERSRTYLAALNRTILTGKYVTGGLDFHGEVLIRFARGQYIWRLEWRTQEPGVVQYR
ncbi:hypothetical protein [Archangium violaceum]|uniref:hypothetical protein n=1 Tax=Archangium violaceum TaxID=83451 RepID=UPI0036D871B6